MILYRKRKIVKGKQNILRYAEHAPLSSSKHKELKLTSTLHKKTVLHCKIATKTQYKTVSK